MGVRERVRVKSDGTESECGLNMRHVILRLECRQTGRKWAIDLTGAHYGIYEPLHDLNQYKSAYVKQAVGYYPLTYALAQYNEYTTVQGLPRLLCGLPFRAGMVLERAISAWELQNQAIPGLLNLEEQSFNTAKHSLLRYLDKSVQSFICDTDFSKDIGAAVSYERAFPGERNRQIDAIHQREYEASEGLDERFLQDE